MTRINWRVDTPAVRGRRSERSGVRGGAVLVLVLFYIVLAGSLSVLLSASMARLVRTERSAHEFIVVRQLLDSGRAWAEAHRDALAAEPVTLSAEALVGEGKTGSVTMRIDPNHPGELIVEVHVVTHSREIRRTVTFAFTA